MLEPIFKELCAEKGVEIEDIKPLIELCNKRLNENIKNSRMVIYPTVTFEGLNTERVRNNISNLINEYIERGYNRNTVLPPLISL